MIFIDLENNPPNPDWLKQADNLTQQLINAAGLDERKKIIEANSQLWGELKGHLSKIRNRKCWYTESINDGAHCHVDHFRPKINALDETGQNQGGYWWLSFDWMNYRYAGPVPNVRKKDYFPVIRNKASNYGDNISLEENLLLDPVSIGDPGLIVYDIEGKVISRSQDLNSRDYKRSTYSIDKYNLNTEGLKEGRRQKQIIATRLMNKSQRLLALQSIAYDQARENEIMQTWKDLRKLAHPDSEYSSAVKYCLKSSGFEWAAAIISS